MISDFSSPRIAVLTPASQVGTESEMTPLNCPTMDRRVDTSLLVSLYSCTTYVTVSPSTGIHEPAIIARLSPMLSIAQIVVPNCKYIRAEVCMPTATFIYYQRRYTGKTHQSSVSKSRHYLEADLDKSVAQNKSCGRVPRACPRFVQVEIPVGGKDCHGVEQTDK
jgi:hypothetical protein